MTDFSFADIHDKDFEVLACRAIAANEGTAVERFKPGRDQGVDGRFFSQDKGYTIIQAKHYLKSGFSNLKSTLKNKELKKVKKLNPSRYIIVTSLPLSQSEKQQIKTIFGKYIKSEKDVIGSETLNDILADHPTIIDSFPSLWLKNAAVLDNIINRAIIGRSQEKLSSIVQTSHRYVQTENHIKAFEQIKKDNVLIVTGDPGIGKTTLAENLCVRFVANEYCFYEVIQEISEAEDVFNREEKQIFLFDDFLGSNFLSAVQGNEDRDITRFIERINGSNNKKFILTSRSTIFQYGLFSWDRFNRSEASKKSFQIVIENLSDLEKARILYDKVYFSDLDEKFIDQIFEDDRYLDIIRHKNYSPRIVEQLFLKSAIDPNVEANDFWQYIEDRLQNPKEIWRPVYNNHLEENTRLIVRLVVLNDGRITEDDLKMAFSRHVIRENTINRNEIGREFRNGIEKTVSCVLNRNVYSGDSPTTVSLFNPSVADFVINEEILDHEYISSILISLESTRSIRFVNSIYNHGILRETYFVSILSETLLEFASRTIIDYELVITICTALSKQWRNLNNIIKEIINKVIEAIDEDELFEGHTTLVIGLLESVLEGEPLFAKDEVICSIAVKIPEKIDRKQDFDAVQKLAKSLDFSVGYDIAEALKVDVLRCFTGEMHDIAASDALLEDLYPGDDIEAEQRISDYLDDQLAGYGVSKDILLSLLEEVDVDQILNDNANYIDDDDQTTDFGGVGSSSKINETQEIRDLFDR